MHVGVDEAWADELGAGVDLALDGTREALADEDDAVVPEDELGVAPQHVPAVLVPDQPAAGHSRPHIRIPRFRSRAGEIAGLLRCGKPKTARTP